jgi:hypothetical protein
VSPDTDSRPGKPAGLWVSVDGPDDWPSWNEAERGGFLFGKIKHSVVLSTSAQILHLKTVADIDEFHRSFFTASPYAGRVDWAAVGRLYDGIIIAPYQWERRLDGDASHWYYGWDCASGCIWNPRAISSISPERSEAPQPTDEEVGQ